MTRPFKLALLVVIGPALFAYVGFLAPVLRKGRGARGHHWRATKRACSLLLRLLDIKTVMRPSAAAAIGADENSIIVVNHRSHLDGFTLMDTIPDRKWFTFAAKMELFQSKLLARGFRHAGLVEIDRKQGKHALGSLTEAVRTMPARRSVVLFAEGTRTDGESLGAFKPGAVLAARATGRTIRPVVIIGSDALLPRKKLLPKPGEVRIEVLETFQCDPGASVEEDLARLHASMSDVFDGRATGL